MFKVGDRVRCVTPDNQRFLRFGDMYYVESVMLNTRNLRLVGVKGAWSPTRFKPWVDLPLLPDPLIPLDDIHAAADFIKGLSDV